MATEVVIRGSVVTWSATFADENGDPVVPASASVFVNYRVSESDPTERDTIEIEMVDETEGTFTAGWSTVDAAAGRAYWSVRASTPDAADDGVIMIKANPANPDPESD